MKFLLFLLFCMLNSLSEFFHVRCSSIITPKKLELLTFFNSVIHIYLNQQRNLQFFLIFFLMGFKYNIVSSL